MNSIFVYCELEGNEVAPVSQELLTKGRSLAAQLGVKLEAVAIGSNLDGIENQILPYGVDILHLFDDKLHYIPLRPILIKLFSNKPQALMGATVIGRRPVEIHRR